MLCAGFLRYFKWLLAGVVGIGFVTIVKMDPYNPPPLNVGNHDNYTFNDITNAQKPVPPMAVRIGSPSGIRSSLSIHSASNDDGKDSADESEAKNSHETSKSVTYNTQESAKEPKNQNHDDLIDSNASVVDITTSGSAKNVTLHLGPPKDDRARTTNSTEKEETTSFEKSGDSMDITTNATANNQTQHLRPPKVRARMTNHTDIAETTNSGMKSAEKSGDSMDMTTNATAENASNNLRPPKNKTNVTDKGKIPKTESTSPKEGDDLMSRYRASNAPVILDGWNRTVQVHLILDVTGSDDIDPASKLLLAAVERSEYTQISALTFIRPAIETFEMFPRKPDLPLLFLIDWGSMDRDCHRLQLVLEDLRSRKDLFGNKTSQLLAEKEEPYFLLVDSSGSTRQTGCSYLFQRIPGADDSDGGDSASASTYAYTNDMTRIRLAKRSIVQNRYYDRTSKEIHTGELSPNQWDSTPPGYDRPVLQIPFSLRESFVIGLRNITGGEAVMNEDSKRDVDVGYFWKSGDYSHYGFYRRDIAKVVKTLHHSAIDKTDGKRMENAVGIVYTEKKEMEAGHVQFKYIEELLACKIVVITQRDEWEDHYRLMESLASGALVMTDSMVALPEGFIDKVNILVYDSPKMLKYLIKHYLKPENENERKRIASKGHKLVMGRHRCWHRLEELLFGKPLTYVDQRDLRSPPKEVPPQFLI
jgi:hypothetical protein